MTAGARQVIIERDDLERLVELVEELSTVEHAGGLVEHRYHLDDADARLLDRVAREVLG